jgi:aspartyl-tRNA(Asn)/glutamyl-tRNA(Gln) amidotransferase subunit C
MLHDLNQIVEHVSRLQEVDTTAASNAGQSLGAHNREAASLVLREDRVTPSLSHEDAMRNAPDTDGTYFRVPKVIER